MVACRGRPQGGVGDDSSATVRPMPFRRLRVPLSCCSQPARAPRHGAPAHAELGTRACGDGGTLRCGTLDVPDRPQSGGSAAQIGLAERPARGRGDRPRRWSRSPAGPGRRRCRSPTTSPHSLKPLLARRDLARLRSARHRLLRPARLLRRRAGPSSGEPGARVRGHARRRAELLPQHRQRGGHRGAARRGRLPQARPLRRLLRDARRAHVRGAAPRPRRRRSSSTPSCRSTDPTSGRARRSPPSPRVLRDLCSGGACRLRDAEPQRRPARARRRACSAPSCAARSPAPTARASACA